jgi:hypothetical protein
MDNARRRSLKSTSLVKSDAAEQKATAGFLEFDFPKRAKHWQPRSLTNIDRAVRYWQGVCSVGLAKIKFQNHEPWLREATADNLSNCGEKSSWLVAG